MIPRLSAALADRYRIDRELGAGGMATVYLAHDLKHDRNVAVKVLRPELAAVIGAERFLAEIRTTANLQHPHILPLFDSGEADSYLFYVMPYVEGISLRDRMSREKQLPIHEAVRIATEVASALDYAHRHGVIHRDIKPENIMLHDGSALVADFGIALAASKAGTRMTETGMSLGTPQYMSPEQAMGERELDSRSDVYALGCVTYEMLTGEPPFSGPTAQAIVAKIMTAEPVEMTTLRKTIPGNVADAVHTALQKLPADRFSTAAQFAEALAGHATAAPSRTSAGTRAHAAGGDAWRRRFQLACALAVVFLVVGIWGWLSARSAAQRPIERSYLSLGDSAQLQFLSEAGSPLALSPDGSQFAFLGDSLLRIWIKRRGDLHPAPRQGTEHASSPVFSPDGQWLAYVADRHLKKIRVDGGASVTIADSAGIGFGLAWLDDETIVFPHISLLGLRRVSAAGGPTSIVVPDSTFKGLAPMLPTPLPHAQGVIFTVCASGCVAMDLYVMDFKSMRPKPLLHDVSMGWYLPTGDLLYVRRDGVAMVAPFDLGRLEIHGAAVPVLQGVGQTIALARLAWSRSGRLIYDEGTSETAIVSLQHKTLNGDAVPFDSSWSGEFNSFSMSPDGRRTAIGITTPGAGLDIWIKQLDRGPLTRLTSSGHDRRPAWSPDGREIAFIRDTGTSGGDVYVRAADGSGVERRMVHLDRAAQEVSWSHDGRWILVRTETGAAGNGDILAFSTTGDSAVVKVATSSFTEVQPVFSPDDKWVAYVSNDVGYNNVYVRPFPNVDAGHWQVSTDLADSPVWAPDGKAIYYLGRNSRMYAAQVTTTPTFAVTALKPMFSGVLFSIVGFHQSFEMTHNGEFVFLGVREGPPTRAKHLVEVDNWFADIKAKLKP